MPIWIKSVRWVTLILVISNMAVIILGGFLVISVLPSCGHGNSVPYVLISIAAVLRIIAIVYIGIAQKATATMILENVVVDAAVRHERRLKYKRWLWWTRYAMVITVLQLMGAAYFMFSLAQFVFHAGRFSACVSGMESNNDKWALVSFMILVILVALLQCLTGSDVLRWRSFYATQDDAWKAHYREVFDHGIREALCCLGRAKYMSVLKEDQVYSVARLLGDLVAYRASGTGHLELLAGLALLQGHSQSPKSYRGSVAAPDEQIQEAADLHRFAVAAYTGPLIDLGRNPILFPCVWLFRQGIMTPWTRHRRPVLEGDNWWRGHAAAFIKYAKLPPGAIRHGRVSQGECEAAYFILVLHHLKSVVIAVRGTATPEDLITDGLCRECSLTEEELDGLLNNTLIHPDMRQRLISTFPHYAHSGIVEAARDLFKQIEGNPENDSSSGASGFLSSLLGHGCECDGYNLRIVGHSLGGAIAALLGMRLYSRYPKLHVYAYGSLPCVDSIVADACSDFVTSIIYDNEFSARLSVGSILRLRAAALTALSQDTATDTAMIIRLARLFLYVSKSLGIVVEKEDLTSELLSGGVTPIAIENLGRDQGFPEWKIFETEDNSDEIDHADSLSHYTNPFAAEINSLEDPVSEFMEIVPRSNNGADGDGVELFLPGLVIHIVREPKSIHTPFWSVWKVSKSSQRYEAYIADRESFKDIIVSPSMFLDHLPWRCQCAMQNVLETRKSKRLLDKSQMV